MAWYNSNWKYRVKITVDKDKVGSTLTDFPVYVDLNDLPSDFHNNVKSDGGDIRVTRSDGTTECPREIVFYDAANDKGELHFKANSLSSTTDTDFYIYYGNASASDYAIDATYGAENVWTNYFAVYHLQASMLDSTTNDNDLTDGGSSDATGKIGKGRSLSGDYLKTTNSLDLSDTQKVSITFWLNKTNNTGTQLLYEFGPNYNSYTDDFTAYTDTDFWIASRGNVGYNIAKCALPTTGSFIYLAHIRDFSASASLEVIPYINGQAVAYDKSAYNSENTGYFGNRQFFISGRNGGSYFTDGIYDEFRISKNVLASTWISTEYNNQSSPSTFYTAGSQEAGATDANSERGLYIRSKNTNSSERSIYSLGSQTLSTSYFNVVFSEPSISASGERGLYVSGYGTDLSERRLYITGSTSGSGDRTLYVCGLISNGSERSLYLQGSLSSNSERGLLLEGKPVIDERGLYLLGYIYTSSTRDLYLGGIDTGTSERNLYTQGTSSSTSNRSFYIQGSISTNNERGLYLIGKSLEGERGLYLHGFETGSSEKKLYLEGANVGYDNRGLYIQGYLSDSSSRGLYLYGYGVGTPERALHIAGVGLGASERGVCVEGKDIDVSERGLYIQGSLEDGSNRKLYLEGYISANIERTLYIQGQETLNSSMPLYIWGYEVGSFERNLYIQGYDIKSSSRGLYIQGYLSDNSDRELYLFGYDIETSERGLYLVGLDLETSERSIYLEGKDMGASERDLYVHGFVRSFSNRGLYIVGDGEVPFHEGNVIIKIDEGLYLNPKTGRIYVAIE